MGVETETDMGLEGERVRKHVSEIEERERGGEGKREREAGSLLTTGRAHTTPNVEQAALFRATLLLKRE